MCPDEGGGPRGGAGGGRGASGGAAGGAEADFGARGPQPRCQGFAQMCKHLLSITWFQ